MQTYIRAYIPTYVRPYIHRYKHEIKQYMPYHIMSHRIRVLIQISYHIVSCHTIPYHIVSCHIIPCHAISCHVWSCHARSGHIIRYHTISYRIISYLTVSYHSISYYINPSIVSHHSILCLPQHHVISYHILSYHITSYHVPTLWKNSADVQICRALVRYLLCMLDIWLSSSRLRSTPQQIRACPNCSYFLGPFLWCRLIIWALDCWAPN